jgi:hypothetical protein
VRKKKSTRFKVVRAHTNLDVSIRVQRTTAAESNLQKASFLPTEAACDRFFLLVFAGRPATCRLFKRRLQHLDAIEAAQAEKCHTHSSPDLMMLRGA